MSKAAELWCEHCGSTVAGAHLAGCGEGPLDIQPKKVAEVAEIAAREKKKTARTRANLSLRFDDDDPEIDTMSAISHLMDYQIKRTGLNQRQIDRIGNWFIDKYIDEIKWP